MVSRIDQNVQRRITSVRSPQDTRMKVPKTIDDASWSWLDCWLCHKSPIDSATMTLYIYEMKTHKIHWACAYALKSVIIRCTFRSFKEVTLFYSDLINFYKLLITRHEDVGQGNRVNRVTRRRRTRTSGIFHTLATNSRFLFLSCLF